MIQRLARLHRNLVDVLLHASADVQQQDQRHRLVAVRKGDNRLRLAFIGDREVALGEILDQLVAVRHLNVHAHVRHAGFERRSGLIGLIDCRRRGFCVDSGRPHPEPAEALG